jgi:hypothetical protein
MRKWVLAFVSLCCALSWAGANAQQGGGAESEIRGLNQREVQALLQRDVETLKGLWSNDFVVTNPFNQFIRKRGNVLDLVRSGKLAFSKYDRQLEYVRLYRDNSMAIVAGNETVTWAGKVPTAGQTSRLRFTSVWLRQDNRWQQIARHASFVSASSR